MPTPPTWVGFATPVILAVGAHLTNLHVLGTTAAGPGVLPMLPTPAAFRPLALAAVVLGIAMALKGLLTAALRLHEGVFPLPEDYSLQAGKEVRAPGGGVSNPVG
jgi:hypothetical protein